MCIIKKFHYDDKYHLFCLRGSPINIQWLVCNLQQKTSHISPVISILQWIFYNITWFIDNSPLKKSSRYAFDWFAIVILYCEAHLASSRLICMCIILHVWYACTWNTFVVFVGALNMYLKHLWYMCSIPVLYMIHTYNTGIYYTHVLNM